MRHDVTFTREIQATPEEVFDAFTNPDGQEAFYGQDDPGWTVRSRCDLRVGGAWTVDFGPSPRELYRHHHVFEVIDRPRRLLISTTETRLDGSTLRFKTEFTFEPRDTSTVMTMIQKGLPTAELREEHRRGVPNAVSRLEGYLRRSRTLPEARDDQAR